MTVTIDRVSHDQPQATKNGADRLPFQKKVNLLSDRGLWPPLEALAKQHGWYSAEVQAFIDRHLPKARCPIDGREFYVYSKRVKYCSDKCRRAAAAGHVRPAQMPAKVEVAEPAKPKARITGDLCVRLERAGTSASDRRYYTLMVVQDLFGTVSLVRRWGRSEAEHSQQLITTFRSLDQAVEQLEHHRQICLKRGYRLTAVERGHLHAQATIKRDGGNA
jgi:predicted DNA-binding WGR domain protein